MRDNETLNVGDVCTYSYFEHNKSLSIVEVMRDLSEEIAVVKFHQIIFDDSGNDLFTYLYNTGKTMNVSKIFLKKIDLVNRQREEIERLAKEVDRLSQCVLYHDGQIADAIKEFAERLKTEMIKSRYGLTVSPYSRACNAVIDFWVNELDQIAKEMVGEQK